MQRYLWISPVLISILVIISSRLSAQAVSISPSGALIQTIEQNAFLLGRLQTLETEVSLLQQQSNSR